MYRLSESFGKQNSYFNVDNTVEFSSYDGNNAVPEEFESFTVQVEVGQFEGSI